MIGLYIFPIAHCLEEAIQRGQKMLHLAFGEDVLFL